MRVEARLPLDCGFLALEGCDMAGKVGVVDGFVQRRQSGRREGLSCLFAGGGLPGRSTRQQGTG